MVTLNYPELTLGYLPFPLCKHLGTTVIPEHESNRTGSHCVLYQRAVADKIKQKAIVVLLNILDEAVKIFLTLQPLQTQLLHIGRDISAAH